MSKIEELTKIVHNAEDDYKTMVNFFRTYITIEEYESYDEKDIFEEPTIIKLSKLHKISHTDDLFKQYPASLFNDKKYDRQYIEFSELGLLSKYDFPFPPMMCEDPKIAKQRIYLDVWAEYKSSINEDLFQPAERITSAMGKINHYAGESGYSDIFYRMSVIFNKAKSAIKWLDYLDKNFYTC